MEYRVEKGDTLERVYGVWMENYNENNIMIRGAMIYLKDFRKKVEKLNSDLSLKVGEIIILPDLKDFKVGECDDDKKSSKGNI